MHDFGHWCGAVTSKLYIYVQIILFKFTPDLVENFTTPPHI